MFRGPSARTNRSRISTDRHRELQCSRRTKWSLSRASGVDASLILCGRSHIPRIVRLSDGRLIVNPGSVGLPGYRLSKPISYQVETGTPDACYAIAERQLGCWSMTFRYVPYDPAPMAALARRRGMHDWANAIATGWVE